MSTASPASVIGGRLDGEFVVFDERGVPDFNALQNAIDSGKRSNIVYVLFDLMFLDGQDYRGVPLTRASRGCGRTCEHKLSNANDSRFAWPPTRRWHARCLCFIERARCESPVQYRPGKEVVLSDCALAHPRTTSFASRDQPPHSSFIDWIRPPKPSFLTSPPSRSLG